MVAPFVRTCCSSAWASALLVAGLAVSMPTVAAPTNVVAQRAVVVGDREHGATVGDDSVFLFTGKFQDEVEAWVGGTHPYPGYPDFTTSEPAWASQKSNIDVAGGVITGQGEAGIGFSVVDADWAYAKSSLDIWFDLTSPHSFVLKGTLGSRMDGGLGLGAASLAGPVSFAFKNMGGWDPEQGSWAELKTISRSGVLAPGSYHLSVVALVQPQCEVEQCSAYSFMGGSSSFDLSLQVAAVPEPATYGLMLAGLGLLGFAVRGRRTQRNA